MERKRVICVPKKIAIPPFAQGIARHAGAKQLYKQACETITYVSQPLLLLRALQVIEWDGKEYVVGKDESQSLSLLRALQG